MEIDRADGPTPNQLRPLPFLVVFQIALIAPSIVPKGRRKFLPAVYGLKAGTKNNENPEKARVEVIWKPKTGHIGKSEKEYEMILKRTLQSICLLTAKSNTTTSVIVQVVYDDGAHQM